MKQEDRIIKISRLAARTSVKIFIIILLVGILPLVSGDQPWSPRLQSSHLVIPNKWTLIFPAILFIGFVALLILCIKRKYQVPDFNWLLVLNTLILLAYLVMLYSRIYHALTVV